MSLCKDKKNLTHKNKTYKVLRKTHSALFTIDDPKDRRPPKQDMNLSGVDEGEDLSKFSDPSYRPIKGCCKYPIGNGKNGKYRWCTEKDTKNGYCEKHHKKCHTGKSTFVSAPYETGNKSSLFIDRYWDDMKC